MKFRIVVEPDEDGVFVASCPSLPGCHSQGRTRGELLGSVGSIDNPLHDLDNLVAMFGFPGDFDPDAIREAEALPANPDPEEFEGRVDLRELPVITIDPKDAEDHDDAISLETVGEGLVRLQAGARRQGGFGGCVADGR